MGAVATVVSPFAAPVERQALLRYAGIERRTNTAPPRREYSNPTETPPVSPDTAASFAADKSLTDHPEEQAVREPLDNYMQGHATDDPAFMRQAFMDTAHIESVREGPLTSWRLDTYCQRFKGTPAADEATRRRTIDAIDIAGTAASAKITLVHGSTTFIDYFLLLKTDAGWKISNKAFHVQSH